MDGFLDELRERYYSRVERLRGFARAMIGLGEDAASVQIRADLWAEMSSDETVRRKWATVMRARRAVLKRWIEEGIGADELDPIPSNALAAILLSLGEGLLLHAGLDPTGFRWVNVARALDAILEGLGCS